jgi:hypothetical protein
MFVLSALLACAGAGDSGFAIGDVQDPGASLDSGRVQDTGADTATDTGPAEEPADVRAFGMLQSTRVQVASPFGGASAPSDTRTVALVAWTRRGLDVTWTETLCGLSSTEAHTAQITYPDAFLDALPPATRVGRLDRAEAGAAFTAGPFADVIGVQLDDPANDAMPTRASDPRVFDQDGDGHPGMTIDISAGWGFVEGSLYLAQRNIQSMEGTVVATDRIEGYLDVDMEQVILGATRDDFLEQLNTPDPTRSANWFVLQQVDASMDCAALLRDQRTIFGR